MYYTKQLLKNEFSIPFGGIFKVEKEDLFIKLPDDNHEYGIFIVSKYNKGKENVFALLVEFYNNKDEEFDILKDIVFTYPQEMIDFNRYIGTLDESHTNRYYNNIFKYFYEPELANPGFVPSYISTNPNSTGCPNPDYYTHVTISNNNPESEDSINIADLDKPIAFEMGQKNS